MPRNRFQDTRNAILFEVYEGTMTIEEAKRALGIRSVENVDLLAEADRLFNEKLEEVPEGEESPSSEIPVENLGGLFEKRNLSATNQHLERLRDPSRWERG